MQDSVLVQAMAMRPASAARQPKAPPRIQWVVLRKATMPTPCSAASAIARSVATRALRMPGPPAPVLHLDRAEAADQLGLGRGVDPAPLEVVDEARNPVQTVGIDAVRLDLAWIRAQVRALSGERPARSNARATTSTTSSRATLAILSLPAPIRSGLALMAADFATDP